MLEVQPVTAERLADAEALFCSSPATAGCFCMWFIIPVRDYHAGGGEESRRLLRELVDSGGPPVGVLAYRGGEAVGWCAAGPRSRYARAIRTPTLRGQRHEDNDAVWLVPCFYIRQDARRAGVGQALLEGAVGLAQAHDAAAIEGFPFAAGAKKTRETMVGSESAFAACGFSVVARPSQARVVMQRDLGSG